MSGCFCAGKRVKTGRRGMCSAPGHVLPMPLWPSTRRSERSLSTRRRKSCKRRISAWKHMEGSQGKCPKYGRLYASAVKRSRPKWGGKMPRPWVCPKSGRTAEHHFPASGRSGTCSFLRGFPTFRKRLLRIFFADYSFLSNGQFCPLALYGKAQ